MIGGLADAVGFLTRIPVSRGAADVRLGRAVPWFPVVGGVVGLATAVVYVLGLELVPALPAAAVAVTAQVLLTGAFHEDGLADTADAAGGWSREQRLEILDDPRHGTYGVLALVATVLVRVAALSALSGGDAVAALVSAHVLARAGAVVVMLRVPPARPEGLGASYTAEIPRRAAGVSIAMAAVAAAASMAVAGVVACAVVGVVAVGAIRYARRAFGGITGDLLGATEQVGEAAVLLIAAATV